MLPLRSREDSNMPTPEGIAAFLGALRALTSLQHLELQNAQLAVARPPFTAFAALTASSQLTALVLQSDDSQHTSDPLPRGAMQHVLPAGRQLPSLRRLAIVAQLFEEEYAGVMGGEDLRFVRFPMVGQDFGRISSSCSNLETLDIRGVVDSRTDMSALAQLPRSCTNLTIGGAAAFHKDVLPLLAKLTQLSSLNIQVMQVSYKSIEQLTALRGLRELTIANNCEGLGVDLDNGCNGLYLEHNDEVRWQSYGLGGCIAVSTLAACSVGATEAACCHLCCSTH